MKKAEKNENFLTKDLIPFKRKSDHKPEKILLYSHVVIEWLREWSKDQQDEILTDGLLVFKGK